MTHRRCSRVAIPRICSTRFVFAGNANPIRRVVVGGEVVVDDFRHRDRERIAARYREVVERLARAR